MPKRRLVGNIASMTLWQAGNYLIPLLTFPYLTRTLGVPGYGAFTFSFAIVAYAVMVTDWGFNLSATGEIARSRGDRARITDIFWNTLGAKLFLGLGCALALLVAAVAVPSLRAVMPVLAAASLLILANVLTVNWCLQGLERLGSFAFAATIGRALTVPATFLLVHDHGDAWIAALVQAGGALVAGGCSIILLARTGVIGRPDLGLASIARQLRQGWHLFVSSASVNFYTTTNTSVLGFIGGPVMLGPYAAADRLRAAAQGVIAPISQAVYPQSTRVMDEDRAAGLAFARRLLLFQGAITGGIAIFLLVCAGPIIRILAGPSFEAAVPILRLLAPVPFLVGISNVLGIQIMLPLGMKIRFSRILIGAAVVNLALVLPLTWLFQARGTAAATLLAETYVVASMALALARSDIRLFKTAEVAGAV